MLALAFDLTFFEIGSTWFFFLIAEFLDTFNISKSLSTAALFTMPAVITSWKIWPV